MPGPVSMALGPFAFEAMGFGYDGLQRRLDTPWAEVEIAGAMDALQWTGPKADTVTIKGVLFPREFGGQASLDGLAAAAEAGQPMMFVSGSAAAGRIYGYHVVEAIDEDRSYIDAAGAARRNAYQIRLRRYDGPAPAPGGIAAGLALSGSVSIGPVTLSGSISIGF